VHVNVSKGPAASIFRTEIRSRSNFVPVKDEEAECVARMGEMRKTHKISFGEHTRERNNVSDVTAIRLKTGRQSRGSGLSCGLDSADSGL
jgi:hypothetical protein